nr:MAG TPA: Tle cognate immunity protein 4 C-terminal domain [Caudoviricetes sp.]
MGQKDVEREKPLFDGQSAEEFIKRWNAITKAIKMRAEMAEQEKVVSYDVIR